MQMNLLLPRVNEIGKKCQSYGIKYVFFLSITFNTSITGKLLNVKNEMIETVCLENNYHYIVSENVNENNLFKGGINLQNSRKKNYLIILLPIYKCGAFSLKHEHPPNVGQCEALVKLVQLVQLLFTNVT